MSEGGARQSDRPTGSPPFDPEAFARDSEHMLVSAVQESMPPTAPPESVAARLRDSCKDLHAFVEPGLGVGMRGIVSRKPTLDAVVVLEVEHADVDWFALDALAKLLAAEVDGQMTVEELLAVTHTDVPEGLKALEALANAGVVAFRGSVRR